MKKRTLIAIIITIIAVVITNKYWLTFKPMPISLDITGKDKVNIEIQLNKKDNDEFKKVKSDLVEIDLKENSHADFTIHRAKCPTRLRFVILGAQVGNKLTLSNIQLKNGEFTINDLSKFTVDGAKATVENNQLVLSPKEAIITATYPDTLYIKAGTVFEWKLLTIILVLTFLLAYRLSDYVADFNTEKKKPLVDIVFLLIFFICLFIPMSHINKEAISQQENRSLAKLNPLILEHNKINFNFGNEFNAWFNDRFSMRRYLIDTNYLTKMYLNKYLYVNSFVYIKKNNWILGNVKSSTDRNPDFFIPKAIKYLEKFQDFCEANNAKLYIIVVPNRNSVYIDKYNYINLKPEDIKSQIPKTKLNILLPDDEMKAGAKKDYVFFKTDHHWTDYGVSIVYSLLLDRIKKDFPNVKPYNENDYTISYSKKVKSEYAREYEEGVEISIFCPFLKRFSDKILDTDYKYYTHKKESLMKMSKYYNDEIRMGRDFNYPLGADLKVMEFGTSMCENFNDFLPYSFKSTKYYRLNTLNAAMTNRGSDMYDILKYYKKDILEYKPNVIILCLTTGNFGDIAKLEGEKE